MYIDEQSEDSNQFMFGGEQQKNIRSGTENVPGIAGTVSCSEDICYEDLDEKVQKMRKLKDAFH